MIPAWLRPHLRTLLICIGLSAPMVLFAVVRHHVQSNYLSMQAIEVQVTEGMPRDEVRQLFRKYKLVPEEGPGYIKLTKRVGLDIRTLNIAFHPDPNVVSNVTTGDADLIFWPPKL